MPYCDRFELRSALHAIVWCGGVRGVSVSEKTPARGREERPVTEVGRLRYAGAMGAVYAAVHRPRPP